MFLNFVFVFANIARIQLHLVFTNEKGELIILTTKHGLWRVTHHITFVSDNHLWPQRICWATNRKMYFLVTDLSWVIMAICRATRKICFLTTIRWPFAIAELLTYCRRLAGKYTYNSRDTTLQKSIRRIRDCVRAFILSTDVFEPRTSTGNRKFSSSTLISPFSSKMSSCKF